MFAFGMRYRSLCLVVCLAIGASLCSSSLGQIKYNPDDEVIEKMARAAVGWLESNTSSQLGGEQLALVALTISEVSKRYDRLVPVDNPFVVRSTNSIKAYIDAAGPASMANHNNIYYPALALILLADVDDVAYEQYIIKLINMLEGWQQPNGSYNYPLPGQRDESVGDISQTQYACLAFFIAKHHGFRIDPQVAKRTLEWLVDNPVDQMRHRCLQRLPSLRRSMNPGSDAGPVFENGSKR